MARTIGYAGRRETIAATTAQTLIFNSRDFDPNGMVAALVSFTGTGNDIGNVQRVRVKANGEVIHDYTGVQLRAHRARFTRSNQDLAATRAAFTIPFNVPDAENEDKADLCGWPIASECQIEITTDASVVAGAATLAFVRSTIRPRYYSTMIGTPMNIAASQTNAEYQLVRNGLIQAMGINTVGVDLLRVVLDGVEVVHCPGAAYLGGTPGDLLRESQFEGNGESIVDPIFVKLAQGLRASQGSSFVRLTTGSGWAGVANELVTWALNSQG